MSACRRIIRLTCSLVLLAALLATPGAAFAPPAVHAERPPASPLAPPNVEIDVPIDGVDLSAAGASPAAVSDDFHRWFPITNNNTGDVEVVVDSQGRLHGVISAKTSVEVAENTYWYPAYYGFCAANCQVPGNWTWTIVGNTGFLGGSARVAVNRQGRPRIMWVYQGTFDDPAIYAYAECDAGCTNAANWNAYAAVGANDFAGFGDGDVAGDYFALDPNGNPRFIYRETDSWTGERGTWYAFCDGDCLDGNWFKTQISPEVMSQPSLEIDSTGEPHIALYAGNAVWYMQTTEFNGGRLWGLGTGNAFSLALDSQDRPRLAMYTGFYESDDPDNELLALSTCDADCNLTENWDLRWLGTERDWGYDVALALDSADRPHLAFSVEDITNSVYGLVYARCTGGCDSEDSQWVFDKVDDGDAVEAENPVPPVGSCTPVWLHVGGRPSLAVDAGGRPYIGYDAVHYQGFPCPRIEEDVRLGRIAVGSAGAGGDPSDGNARVLLPLVRKR